MSSQPKEIVQMESDVKENSNSTTSLTDTVIEEASEGCEKHDLSARVARKTHSLNTRLNANRCLVLQRYFKLLNAACPDAVAPFWEALLKLGNHMPFVNTVSASDETIIHDVEVKKALVRERFNALAQHDVDEDLNSLNASVTDDTVSDEESEEEDNISND